MMTTTESTGLHPVAPKRNLLALLTANRLAMTEKPLLLPLEATTTIAINVVHHQTVEAILADHLATTFEAAEAAATMVGATSSAARSDAAQRLKAPSRSRAESVPERVGMCKRQALRA